MYYMAIFQNKYGYDVWEEWPDGHCRFVYAESCEEAKKHSSGWAMRNTNNHNVNILKKSCLGVLVCSKRCIQKNGKPVTIRPAICDKARKKQQGKSLFCMRSGLCKIGNFWGSFRQSVSKFDLWWCLGNPGLQRPRRLPCHTFLATCTRFRNTISGTLNPSSLGCSAISWWFHFRPKDFMTIPNPRPNLQQRH